MMTPDLPFWTRLLIRIAVEAACVVGAAMLVDRLIRPPFWRRALWQSTVVCLLLLTASELSGFGRGLASYLFGHARLEQKLAVWTSPAESAPPSLPSLLPSPPPSFAPAPITVPSAVVKPEIVRLVWWPGLLWLAGGLAVLGRVAAAQILFISLRRRRPVVTQTDLHDRVHAILQRLAFRREVRLLQSPGLTGPIAFGILRPSVGLPVDFAAKFSRAEQDAMLAHELAHLASRDPLWYLLADASSAALWWHPQAWWARRRLHRASELAADEAAALFPEGPAALAECLVTLGRQMTQRPAASRMGVEGGGFRSHLAERVQRLLRLADTARQPSYGWRAYAAKIVAIITISAAAIALSGCLQSRNAEKQPTLQANLSQSWAASPAATVWHSALPLQKLAPSSAPIPVAYRAAKLDESVTGQGAQLANPPITNSTRRTSEEKEAAPANQETWKFPNVGTNLPLSLLRRATILRKMTEIRVREVPDIFQQGLPLSEVLPVLHELTMSNDVDHIGLDFRFNPRSGDATIDPGTITIEIIPPLKNVTLLELLDAIRQTASQRIEYAVEDYVVWFVVLPPGGSVLETQSFYVRSSGFVPSLPGDARGNGGGNGIGGLTYTTTNSSMGDSAWPHRYFASLGIYLTNDGESAFFNANTSFIEVRATPLNMIKAGLAIARLDNLAPQKPEPPPTPEPVKFQSAQQETAPLGMGTFHVEPNSCVQALRHLFPKDADAQAGILLRRYLAGVGIDLTDHGSFTLLNPRTGEILARATMRNLDSMAQAIELLNKTPPVDSVDRAKELVNTSRTTGSIFLDKPPERAALPTGQETRTFHVDPNTFLQGLQEVFPQILVRPAGIKEATGGLPYLIGTNGASGRNSPLTQCFASIGISFTNNGAFYLVNERIGEVLVRASAQDLDTVEKVLELLNRTPPQVQIDAKFVSLKQNDAKGIGFQTYLGSFNPAPTGAHTGPPPGFQGPTSFANPSGVFPGAASSGSNPGQIRPDASDGSLTASALRTVAPNAPISAPSLPALGTITGIMTDPQFRMALQAIAQRDGTEVRSAPRVTALSGRLAHVGISNIVINATNAPMGSPGIASGKTTNTFAEGPAVDILPTVSADGFSIQLLLKVSWWEFLDYDKPVQDVSPSNGVSSLQAGVPPNAPLPEPRYRNSWATTTVKVWDGQTALLGGMIQESGPSQQQTTNSQRENLMIFITATIIDPAGNRVHTDDEMPFAKVSIPPQQAIPPQPQSTNAPK